VESIQLKMFAVIGALMLALVVFLATYFPAQHVAASRRALEHKAETYARLISREVESAIAFQDQQTVREAFDAAATDGEVLSLALYTAGGKPLHVFGAPAALDAARPVASEVPRLETLPTMIRATIAVVSREGPRGTLVLELSTASLDVERGLVRRAAVLGTIPALALGLLAAALLARSIGGRVRAVARVATAVADGDLAQPRLTDTSADEVGQLARAFNDMMAEIERLLLQISTSAAEEHGRLNQLVAARTGELRERNEDLHAVLDHVGDGFVMVDLHGRMSRERSAILATWFGAVEDDTPFWDYLARSDPRAAASFQLGFEMMLDDVLPLELTIDQLPHEVTRGARSYRLACTPILNEGKPTKLMLVVSDVTDELERARVEEEAREMLNIFDRARRDGDGLAAFVADTDPLIKSVISGEPGDDLAVISRQIHTIKGAAGMFGFPRLTHLCHAMETAVAETGEAPGVADRQRLARLWEWMASTAQSMAGDAPPGPPELEAADLQQLRDLLLAGRPRVEILDLLGSLDHEPAERRLTRLGEHARSLAARLRKPLPSVHVEANGVRLDPVRFAPLWSALVHLVRNAVDHGLESAEERALAGKPEAGTLMMRTVRQGPDVVLEISDDGGGIDWSAIAARASGAGMAHDTPAELEAALFHDGLSTKDSVTEYSGRGVGLGAVREACRDLGGTLDLVSTRGEGTTWRFRIPTMNPAAIRAFPAILSLPSPPRARSASLSMSREAPMR
jgi:two-component system chemotaxis sensor kinase CheA